ncbi:MAG: hypothetical protein NTV29_09740 [Planctomycetota bacterium]|nr:hypothetical protein [Planctomycetota bacterium]
MKSQTQQNWLHTTALIVALAALCAAMATSNRDAQNPRRAAASPEFFGNFEASEDSDIPQALESEPLRVVHSESQSSSSDVESPASRALIGFRTKKSPPPAAPSEPLAFVQSVQGTVQGAIGQESENGGASGGTASGGTLRQLPMSNQVARPLWQVQESRDLEPNFQPKFQPASAGTSTNHNWLKGEGFIIGWDGKRCITAGQMMDPEELSYALAIEPTISPRNRADLALANYTDTSGIEGRYEDNDLWESDQDGPTAPAGGSGPTKQPEALGVPPPRPQPQFLRDTSVLLDPGEYQFEYGLSYTTNVQTTALGVNVNDNTVVTSLRTLTRTATIPTEMRVGFRNDIQGFLSLPFGYNLQQISVANTADSSDGIGIGDLTFGLTRVLRKPQPERFTILGNLAASAPTGLAQLSSLQQVPGVSLGSGYWTLSGGLVFIRTIDPIAAFVGLNYVKTFEAMINNLDIQPGDIFSYRFGLGYAINSRVTISSSFNGAYITDLELGGRLVPGSAREPLTVRLAATILSKGPSLVGASKGRRKTTEPFIALGVTDAAPDTSFGVRWTY